MKRTSFDGLTTLSTLPEFQNMLGMAPTIARAFEVLTVDVDPILGMMANPAGVRRPHERPEGRRDVRRHDIIGYTILCRACRQAFRKFIAYLQSDIECTDCAPKRSLARGKAQINSPRFLLSFPETTTTYPLLA
jgi:hypothetical protein